MLIIYDASVIICYATNIVIAWGIIFTIVMSFIRQATGLVIKICFNHGQPLPLVLIFSHFKFLHVIHNTQVIVKLYIFASY